MTGLRWFRFREAVWYLWTRLLRAVIGRLASAEMRHAALLLGFHLTYGYGRQGWLLGHLDEYSLGNEISQAYRWGTGDEIRAALDWWHLEQSMFRSRP